MNKLFSILTLGLLLISLTANGVFIYALNLFSEISVKQSNLNIVLDRIILTSGMNLERDVFVQRISNVIPGTSIEEQDSYVSADGLVFYFDYGLYYGSAIEP